MSWIAGSPPVTTGAFDLKGGAQTAVVVFFAYLLGAEAAFFIGTLSDKIFAPFWPPNIVLLCALLYVAPERRWLVILAALPAHILAEIKVGMSIPAVAIAFGTNVLVAGINAYAIQKFLGAPPWFSDFRKVARYILIAGALSPALVAFGGALVPMLASGANDNYWRFWEQWFAANAVGSLTIGPIALIMLSEGARSFWPKETRRRIEAALVTFALVLVCYLAFRGSAGHDERAFLPTLFYTPVLIILWMTARFGIRGASFAILLTTLLLIWLTLNGPSLFAGADPETNVLALQIFMVSLALPMLLLGASIDEVREAERKKREDEQRMAFVAATANVGLWNYDSRSRQFWATGHCRDMLGIPRHVPLTFASLLSAVHPEDRAIASGIISAQRNALNTADFRIALPDQQIRWISARTTPQFSEDGHAGASGVFVDITDRKAAEAEANRQQRELAHLMRVSQVSELSGGLAHELTQPLTSILANAQAAQSMLASAHPDIRDINEILDDIIREDYRAGEVIKRLRSLLKNGQDSFEAVDLNDLVNSTLHLLRSELISRHIRADVVLANEACIVSGDPVQLQQVLLNLVMNSIDAVHQVTALRRVVTLSTQRTISGDIEVSVADHGTGIGPTHLQRMFEPFFTTKERGLGLGLSICSTIIKRHGGTLSIDNNPEGGATARFHLAPRTKGAQHA